MTYYLLLIIIYVKNDQFFLQLCIARLEAIRSAAAFRP